VGSIWVNTEDQTVHFPLEHQGKTIRGRVSWEALEEECDSERLDQATLVNAFRAMESRIRKAALAKLESGREPLVRSPDLTVDPGAPPSA
jgi:hypothetical protein